MNDMNIFSNVILECWDHFIKFRKKSEMRRKIKHKVIYPSIPILYFGDYHSYIKSRRKIITVGLNPSYREFPYYNVFTRFKGGEKIYCNEILNDDEKEHYLNILNNYFKKNSCPYDWFEHLDLLLQKIECSYYDNKWDNVSLHTDICTPLATNPTWSDFKKTKLSKVIENEGRSIWHNLIKILLPDVVLMSFSKNYLNKIEYLDITNVELLYTFSKKKDGKDRKKPYDILLYREVINGKQVNFLYGEGNVKPFLISDKQKLELGNEIKKIF